MLLLKKSIGRFARSSFFLAAFVLVSAGVSPTGAFAQQEGGAEFCSALLSGNPQGGEGLEAEVRNLVAAAPDVAEDIIGCAAQANNAQAGAIGRGLSKAVAGLKEVNPELADKIAALVAGSDNAQLLAGYAGGEGEEATAAIAEDGETGAGDAPDGFTGGPAAPVLTVGSSGSGTGGGAVSPN